MPQLTPLQALLARATYNEQADAEARKRAAKSLDTLRVLRGKQSSPAPTEQSKVVVNLTSAEWQAIHAAVTAYGLPAASPRILSYLAWRTS